MNVLVVDDKETNRKILRSMLNAKGYNVVEAEDGAAAVSLFKEQHPDIVLMDIMMPGMNGYDATTQIKSISGDTYTPVIYVTALKPEEAISRATEAGGDDFVSKPVNFEILESKIHAHLRIRDFNEKLNQANAKLRLHNQRVQQEHEIVEHIFRNALKYSWLDQRYIRYHVSSVSAFNGDVLLAERRPDGGMCILLGDFTGHGLPAAMGTLPVVKTFFTMVRKNIGVADIAGELNATLKMLLPGNMFCSAALVEIDKAATQLTIWSGGLPPMILHNPREGRAASYECQHMPLGILSADEFEKDVLQLPLVHGSRFYLYTDGIVETANTRGERYGMERMTHILAANPANGFDALQQDITQFRGNLDQEDDLTLVELNCIPLPDSVAK